MNNYTKGPWIIENSPKVLEDIGAPPGYAAISSVSLDSRFPWKGLALVVVRMDDEETDCEDGLANAQLIKSAPEMLSALEEVAYVMSRLSQIDAPLDSAMVKVLSAISAAKGE